MRSLNRRVLILQKSDGQHIPWFSSSVTKEFFFAPNENFLEEHAPKPVVVKNEDSNELEVEKSDNQTVAAKKSDNQTNQDTEIAIEELATPPDDQRIFDSKTYVNQQLANLNALLNDARVIPIEQDGKPWFIFDFVREGSIYEKLGLKNKDVIVQINGFTVDSLPKALKLFEVLQLEEKITYALRRRSADRLSIFHRQLISDRSFMQLNHYDTPCLWVDLDIMESNIQYLAGYFKSRGRNGGLTPRESRFLKLLSSRSTPEPLESLVPS